MWEFKNSKQPAPWILFSKSTAHCLEKGAFSSASPGDKEHCFAKSIKQKTPTVSSLFKQSLALWGKTRERHPDKAVVVFFMLIAITPSKPCTFCVKSMSGLLEGREKGRGLGILSCKSALQIIACLGPGKNWWQINGQEHELGFFLPMCSCWCWVSGPWRGFWVSQWSSGMVCQGDSCD